MKYTIASKVGSGSFGTVYEAHDEAGKRYAAKVVEADDPVARELLKGQFEFLSTLNHKRIVEAVDFDVDSPHGPMLVTEFVDGVGLKTFVETNGDRSLFAVTLKVLDALRYLHNLGRLHGDLKPDGILVFDDEGRPEVKLVDAGFDFGRGSNLPTLAGTLPYLAPEIIRNLPADGRSDLYSLGVVLYEALTGVCPFEGATPEEILTKHLEHVPLDPSKIRPGLPPAWGAFVAGLLKKEPFSRYKDATQAALELGKLFGSPAAFQDHLVPPGGTPPAGADGEVGRIRDFVTGLKSVMICGERGCGVTYLLEFARAIGKAWSHEVSMASLKPDMPALAQIVEVLRMRGHSTSDISPGSGRGDGGDPAASFAEILEAFGVTGPGNRPHLLIIDGGEAMGAGELEMLGRVARRLAGRASVIIGYQVDDMRPDRWPESESFQRILVHPLDREGLETALKRYFGVNAFPEGLVEEIYRTTGGNRRFLEIMLRHMWETGGLRYSVTGDSVELAWDKTNRIPTNLKEVMEEKLGNLSPPALDVLRLVCASGGRLAIDCIREFFLPVDCTSAMGEVTKGGLVEELDGTALLRLRWDGLSDVILGHVPQGWVSRTSLRLASIMERAIKSRGEHYGLGLLYLQAGNSEKAFKSLVEAGDYFARFSPGDAILAYRKALECDVPAGLRAEVNEKTGDVRLAAGDLNLALACFEQASDVRLSSLRKLGWVHGLRGNTDESVRILCDCERRARAGGDLVERSRVLSDLGYIYHMESKGDLALRSLAEAKQFFEKSEMVFEAGIASNRMGILEMRSGRIQDAARAWEDAKVCFERAGAKRHVGMCLMTLGLCYCKQMDLDRATELMENALAIFEETKCLSEKAGCCQNYGLILVDVGDLARARSLAQEAVDLHALLGYTPGVVLTRLLLVAIELEAGNLEEVRRNLAGLASYNLNTFEQCLMKRYLAGASAIEGKREEAFALVDESYRLAREAGDADGEQQAMLKRSEILIRFGEPEEALEVAAKALTVLRLSSSILLANIAERIAGEALCLSGRIEEGLARLLAARSSLESTGESLHLARVLRGLAMACDLGGDNISFDNYFRRAADIFRKRGARYDYALALLLAGRAAGSRASFIRARHYLAEAGRIFKTLGVGDLHRQVVDEMDRIGPDDTETKAVTSLSRISQTLNSSHDLTTVLNLSMDLAMEYLGAERGVLMLEDEASGEPTTIVERKMDKESVKEVISISRSIVESVRTTREPVIAKDATIDPRFKNSKSVMIHNVMSVMCVPLTRGENLVGIIYLDNRDVPSDFSKLEKAFVNAFANQVALAIENARNVGRLYEDVADLKARAGEKYSFASIIGPGKEMQEVFRQAGKAAKSSITVLLTGESGTGKELIAGLLHELSPRRDRPLVKVNCAAIHRDLLEAELFGIEKHVATGVAPRSGFFERADGGTVFLDEVGDMPLTTQTKVLRVLAEKEFERVGGSKVLKVDVRLISATNQDLKDLIKKGQFRKDLYYRLNAMRIHLPPLRERMNDLAILINHFIAKYVSENSKPSMRMSGAALEVLRKYRWPGNVRELEKCIEHAVVVAEGSEIRAEHFPREILDGVASGREIATISGNGPLPNVIKHMERDLILKALRETGGVKTAAASLLGIHESTLRKKIKALGIDSGVE